jgi:hypothetical protein
VQYLEAWDGLISGNPDADMSDEDDDALEVVNGRGILSVDFILRNHPPQPPIGIQFGDWEKGIASFTRSSFPRKTRIPKTTR